MAEPDWSRAWTWVEATMGGPVVRAERQARWRPAWFLEVEGPEGAAVPLYWRGDRGLGDRDGSALRQEAAVLGVLEGEGIPVPHVHGLCEEPLGILMDRVPGEVDFHRAEPAVREAVAEDFLRVVARCQAIEPGRFRSVGLEEPAGRREQALGTLRRWEGVYRASAATPSPLLELALGWLRDRAPEGPGENVLVHGDTGPGQFLFDGEGVTAVLDWEFCHLGDPMEDLGLIRSRDLSYPFGDLRSRFARYSELSGTAVDLPRLRYYSVLAMIMTPAGLHPVLTGQPRGTDFAQVLAWNAVYSRALVQCLAEAEGIGLGPVELPGAEPSPRAWIHRAVVEGLGREIGPAQTEGFLAYRVETLRLLAAHLELADRLGPAFDEAELDAAGEVLGRRPASRAETDGMLTDLIRAGVGGRLEEVVRFLQGRTVRDEALLAPLLGELGETSGLSAVE